MPGLGIGDWGLGTADPWSSPSRIPNPDSPIPAPTHCACIDSESLPTGIERSISGHSSMPTACTASNRRASSPGWPAAAIQLAESLRSEEHTSELQSLMRNSYAVFCLKKKKNTHKQE